VAEEIDAPWAGFHTFRHTCASMLFERGHNAVQVQRWLGHRSASFTIERYVHLLRQDLGEPLRLRDELTEGGSVNKAQTSASLGAHEEATPLDVENAA
jgi:integrase